MANPSELRKELERLQEIKLRKGEPARLDIDDQIIRLQDLLQSPGGEGEQEIGGAPLYSIDKERF